MRVKIIIEWWGVERGGPGSRENACPHMGTCYLVVVVGGCRRREARRMEKLARENKVNEAWRRLPSPAFGRCSRASSLTVTTTPGARTENNSLKGVWWLVENSQAVKGFCVFTRSGCGCWLRQHSTAEASNPLPVCLSRNELVPFICISHSRRGSPWTEKDLWEEVQRGQAVHSITISRFIAIRITMTFFVHWLITAG